MTPSNPTRISRLGTELRSFPRVARIGLAVMLAGLVADVVEHAVIPHVHDQLIAGFPVGEHGAHAVVVAGMVVVLGGVLADGVRTSHGRRSRPERSRSRALR